MQNVQNIQVQCDSSCEKHDRLSTSHQGLTYISHDASIVSCTLADHCPIESSVHVLRRLHPVRPLEHVKYRVAQDKGYGHRCSYADNFYQKSGNNLKRTIKKRIIVPSRNVNVKCRSDAFQGSPSCALSVSLSLSFSLFLSRSLFG